jgi:hypothetical protein
MAIRKGKEQSLQVQGPIEEVKTQCINALRDGLFKKITANTSMNKISAKYNNFTVVGRIDIALSSNGNKVNIYLKTSANVDNIFALSASPNDKIMDAFINNFHGNPAVEKAMPNVSDKMDKYERLEKIHDLKEKGVLTEEEYIVEKNKILK